MNADAIFQGYLTNLLMLQCPAQRKMKAWYQANPTPPKARDDDQNYSYLGYKIRDQTTLERFAHAYRATVDAQKSFEGDLHLKLDSGEEVNIPCLYTRNCLTLDGETIPYVIPVFVERVPNGHRPKGGHVA